MHIHTKICIPIPRVWRVLTFVVLPPVAGVVLAGYDRQFANEHYMSPEDDVNNVDPDKVGLGFGVEGLDRRETCLQIVLL